MEIVGLEARRSDLARGILIARSSSPLDAARQKQLWEALSVAGITESDTEDDAEITEEPERQWHAAPWLPPAADQVDVPPSKNFGAQRSTNARG